MCGTSLIQLCKTVSKDWCADSIGVHGGKCSGTRTDLCLRTKALRNFFKAPGKLECERKGTLKANGLRGTDAFLNFNTPLRTWRALHAFRGSAM